MLCCAALAAYPTPAAAEAATWMGVYGGWTTPELGGDEALSPMFQLEAGIGSDTHRPYVFGLLGRLSQNVDLGTEYGLGLRFASRGFVVGDWGFALDAMPMHRTFGEDLLGAGASASVSLPWGFRLMLSGTFIDRQFGGALAVGLDWASFTAHRETGADWWRNEPVPIARRTAQRRPTAKR